MNPATVLGILLFSALVFAQLRTRDTSVLLAALLVSLWAYAYYTSRSAAAPPGSGSGSGSGPSLTQTSPGVPSGIPEVPDSFAGKYLPLAPIDAQFLPKKQSRYLRYNPHLIALLNDLAFTKMYNAAGYAHLILLLDRFQKTYIYLLIQRYRIQDGVPIFYDLYESALESLYSMPVNVPVSFRHTYGLDPHERIHANIALFKGIFKTMVEILRNFAELELKLPYFPEWLPAAAPIGNERKNVLP
jgi:hypothetical protein